MTAADRKEWRQGDARRLESLKAVYTIDDVFLGHFDDPKIAAIVVTDHNARLAPPRKDALRSLCADIIAMARHQGHGGSFVLSKDEAEGNAFAAIEAFLALEGGDLPSSDQARLPKQAAYSPAPEHQNLGGANAGPEPVAWQRRYVLGTFATCWEECSEADTKAYPGNPKYETRPLYAAPVPVRPEPAAVEWQISDAELVYLQQVWSKYPEGCLIPKALADLEAARAALSRMPAGHEWRPIESAPSNVRLLVRCGPTMDLAYLTDE